jgi:hypothetical protein
VKNKFLVRTYGLLCLGILLSACNPGGNHPELDFEGAWVRPLPTGMKMTAGFGVVRNSQQKPIEITAFSSPSFGDVSLHRTELVDGVSKMREVPALKLAAGESIVLEPGGYHLMLMMPSAEIQPGDVVSIEMTAADGLSFRFDVPVERR